jgi:hypothetical protein
MSTVHLVGGEKGGVGKSVVARALAQYFIDKDMRFVGVDADTSHGALLRYYGEFTQPADLETFASADQIMDRALASDRRVLVDLPAQSARLLRRWIDAGDVVTFAREAGVRMVFWHVSDGGFDSVNELVRVFEELGGAVSFVVVKNLGRSPDFSQLDESAAMKNVLERGAAAMELPALDPATMYKIDRLGTSFWAAIHATEGDQTLTPMERRRAERWLAEAYRSLDGVRQLV